MLKRNLLVAACMTASSTVWANENLESMLSMEGDLVRMTIPGNNPGGNVQLFVDMDNDSSTGSTNQDWGLVGAEYYIENSGIYVPNGNKWTLLERNIIGFSNQGNEIELSIDLSTFDQMAKTAGLLNQDGKFTGFDGNIKANVITFDAGWNVINITGPIQYSLLDISIPETTAVAAAEPQPEPEPVTEPVVSSSSSPVASYDPVIDAPAPQETVTTTPEATTEITVAENSTAPASNDAETSSQENILASNPFVTPEPETPVDSTTATTETTPTETTTVASADTATTDNEPTMSRWEKRLERIRARREARENRRARYYR